MEFNLWEVTKERSCMDGGDTSWRKCRSCESHWILQSSEGIKAEYLPIL
jgi:hypothetical protein